MNDNWREITDYWELLDIDNLPERLRPVAQLINWSIGGYPNEYSPFTLFLDLSGWSLENFGELQFDKTKHRMYFGHIETEYIGEAMVVYANHPLDVEEYVNKVLEAELEH